MFEERRIRTTTNFFLKVSILVKKLSPYSEKNYHPS